MTSIASNKRIVKNTGLLYVRMILIMLITLYTSRVVLNVLGVEDFGIYGIVAGFVLMFEFLNISLTGASSRFLSYQIANADKEKISDTFSASLTIHFLLAILVFILAETIGLWFFETKLSIPENRMFAARIVYQFSILTSLVTITQVPYNAMIMAYERMNIYAYISIIEGIFKLSIAYVILFYFEDKLIIYSILMFLVIFSMAMLYRLYCIKSFSECKFKFSTKKKIIYPMLSFSAYDLYGNFSVMIRGQGINVLMNIFYGPIINAATAIAIQVQNSVGKFADNFLRAVRPQIVKTYAKEEYSTMIDLVFNSSKFSYILMLLFTLPLIIETRFVLNIWLGDVPEYTMIFCQLNLLNGLVSVLFRPITFSIHATGEIKLLSFLNGTILLLTLPISYLFLKFNYPPYIAYVVSIMLLVVACISGLFILTSKVSNFSVLLFIKKVILSVLFITIISSIIPSYLYITYNDSWARLFAVTISSSISIIILTYVFLIDKVAKKKIISMIKKRLNYE